MKRIAIVGATGLVGREMLRAIEDYGLDMYEYTLLCSERSAGVTLCFFGKDLLCERLDKASFLKKYDYALFAVSRDIALAYVPLFVKSGCVVIDNSSAYRAYRRVPLVVPEVNMHAAFLNTGIIANPNCTTIQAVTAIYPIFREYGIKRVLYSTYQAVSGAGIMGVQDLDRGICSYADGKQIESEYFDRCLPHIGQMTHCGYTSEERKMIFETRKLLGTRETAVTATCVRVPVFRGHSVSVNLELDRPFSMRDIENLLSASPSIAFDTHISHCLGSETVCISRLRRDVSVKNGLSMWVSADNLRRGAAGNAVKILKEMLEGEKE